MNKEQALVSVVMPAYNAALFIAESIQSILAQSYQNWELIIINDGSTDNTEQIIQSYIKQDRRIKLLDNETNRGLIETRNRGLQASMGKYIANLDSDDVALPNRLKDQVNFLERNSDYVLVGSACEIIDSNGNKIQIIQREIPDHHIKTLLLFSNYFINSTTMVKAELAKNIGYADDIPLSEDFNFFVEISKKGKIGNLTKPLVQYRTHEHNISKQKARQLSQANERIYHKQLLDLGVEPTKEELTLHGSLVEGNAVSLGFSLIQLEKWLLKLVDANQKSHAYTSELLSYYCAFFYRRACENAQLGVRAISVFRKSAFSKYIKKDVKGNSIFFVKSILKSF